MNGLLKLAPPFVVVLAVTACNTNGGAINVPATIGQNTAGRQSLAHWQRAYGAAIPACRVGRVDQVRCYALIRSRTGVAQPDAGPGPYGGFSPAQLQAAYHLPSSTKGSGQIVAIVNAYDNPNVASDLAKYRSYFGLPKAHFTKYNQLGQTSSYPTGNKGWGAEIDTDVEMVSASCPNCTIYLVEANSPNWSDLQTAEGEAIKLGAHIVSNSWGGSGGSESPDFDVKHVTYLAAAGDSGYGIGDPADFVSVVAIGGTTLTPGGNGKRGWTESVWIRSGAGCSAQPKPKWQHDPGCKFRTANDVSAVADTNTGVAVYDTYVVSGCCWFDVGGTSVSAPLLAGVYGLAGNAAMQVGGRRFWDDRKAQRNHLFHITSGYDGSCNPSYLCTAGTKGYRTYSGPAGWGTPDGIGAF